MMCHYPYLHPHYTAALHVVLTPFEKMVLRYVGREKYEGEQEIEGIQRKREAVWCVCQSSLQMGS